MSIKTNTSETNSLSGAVTFESYRDIKGYVINLDRERWRYDVARKELIGLGFTNIHRWKATDYTEEDVVAEMRQLGATRLDRFYNCAEMSCLLSHFRAMYDFLLSKDQYCLMFEDDVVAVPEFQQLRDFSDISWGDFDLLSFGGPFSGPDYASWTPGKNGWDTTNLEPLRLAEKNKASHVSDCCFWQSHAYLLSRKGAYKLLQDYPAWASSAEYRIPFMDVYMSSNRNIRNKLICHKPQSPENYSLGDKFGYRLRGIMFQRKEFKSTILGAEKEPETTVSPDLKNNKKVTVVVSGSYLDSHPDITFMREVIESLDLTGLPKDTPILLSHDKIKPDTEGFTEKEEAYNKYFENLRKYISTSKYTNIQIVVAPEWGHLTRTLKHAMSFVKTKYVFVLQHDIHIRREIPVLKMMDLMENHQHIKHLRFNVRKNLPTFMWWDGYTGGTRQFAEEEYDGVKVCVTPAWSDQNHLATKAYYEEMVFPTCTNPDGELIYDFMENRMNGLSHHNSEYGTYIYGGWGEPRTSRHSDGRKSSPEPDED